MQVLWDVRESQICDVLEWTWAGRRSITQKERCDRESWARARAPEPPSGRRRPPIPKKGIQLSDTIHLHDLTPAERLVEEAAERGFVEEKELEAFADEHELAEDDVAALRIALEERDVVVRAETPAAGHAPA